MKNEKIAYLAAWVSIGGNVLLFILKYYAGFVSESVAIKTDAWHTLSDSISSIIIIVAVRMSLKPADYEHPFGHGRAELLASLIIGVILVLIAFNFFAEAIKNLSNNVLIKFGNIAIIVTIISIVLKETLAQFAFWSARKTNSRMLKADAWHHRSDAFSSLIILIGIFTGKYIWWIDGILAILVAIFIFYSAYGIIKDSINPILGENPSVELVSKIKKIANESYKFDLEIHHIHIHRYGNHTELTFHIKLEKNMKLEKAHEIANIIETRIKNKLNIESTIHMEPLLRSSTYL